MREYVNEKFGLKEEEEKPEAPEVDKKGLMAWLKETFGLTPKTEQSEKEAPEPQEVEALNLQLTEKNTELETMQAELNTLKNQLEELKKAPAAEVKETPAETDKRAKSTEEFLSKRDIELYNLIKQ